MAANIHVRQERRSGGARAPLVIIDDQGFEVGVMVDYAQYVALLRLVASGIGREAIPRYWRGALDGCLAVSD
jgi:hypothetical protein